MADPKNRVSNVATAPSVAKPSVDPSPSQGRRGRGKLTPEEREARKQELLAEPKDRKFRRLVNHRMPRALKAIGMIAHLANRSQYEYTADQVARITDALARAVKTVSDKFAGNKDNGATFAL